MKDDVKGFGRVAVLMGGWSSEREVSLMSGQRVLAALRRSGVDAFGLDVTEPLIPSLMSAPFDRAFIAMHGSGGEDGLVQGVLEAMKIPYTGSRFAAAALCMDKLLCKRLWLADGLPTPKFLVLEGGDNADAVVEQLGLPIYVKPAAEGSSIGVRRVTEASQIDEAWKNAGGTTTRILAEQAIEGGEYTVGFIGGRWLPPIKIETPRVFYDYKAKYEANDTRYLCPTGLSSALESEMVEIATRSANVLGMTGWGRIDLMHDERHGFQLIEVNVAPGMTERSLIPKEGEHIGMSLEDVVVSILENAVQVS